MVIGGFFRQHKISHGSKDFHFENLVNNIILRSWKFTEPGLAYKFLLASFKQIVIVLTFC